MDECRAWYERAENVQRLVDIPDAGDLPELLELYREAGKETYLKKKLANALVRLGATEAIPLLLDDLEHRDPRFRATVYHGITALSSSRVPPFDTSADARTRKKQILAIREWHQKQTSQ